MSDHFSFPDTPPAKDETPTQIIVLRGMFLPLVGTEGLQPVAAGEAVTVPKWSIECLEAGEDYRPAPLAP